jgi:hypothetical protein
VPRRIAVEIVGDATGLHRALGSATSGTSHLGSAFGSAARLAAAFGLALGAEKLVAFGKDSIEAAANVQKSTEAIRANFGRSSGSVIAFGEHAANAFGISRQASEGFSTQIGITAKNIGLAHDKAAEMDIGLQKLAGSIGLIKGQDPTSVFNTLTLALAGNTRGLKALGIVITPVAEKQELLREHIHKSVADLTAAEKATVIYNIATGKLGALQAEAKKHAGDFADQIIILKARLQNLADEIGAKALPVIQNLVGVISKVAAAPNFTVGVKVLFHGIESGAKSIAEGIQHALTGSTQTFEIKAPSGKLLGHGSTFSKGIIQNIADGLKSANWTAVGHEVGKGISGSIKFTSGALDKLVSGLVDAVSANKGKIAGVGILIIADMFQDLFSPTFWIANWKIALGVLVTALGIAFAPEKFLIALKDIPFLKWIVVPLEKLGAPLRTVVERLGRGIVSGIEDVFPEVGRASGEIGTKIISPLRSLPGRALTVIEDMGRFIGRELGNAARQAGSAALHIGQRIVGALDNFIAAVGGVANRIATRFLGPIENLAGRVVGPVRSVGRTIVNAVGGFIRSVASTAYKIGVGIIQGVINGAESMFSGLVSKLEGILSGALGKAKSFLHIGSPSKVFAEQVGRPIAEGIALGIDQHGHKIGASIIGAVGAARGGGAHGHGDGGGGRGVMQVDLVLDRQTLASVLVNMDKDYRRQNGGRPLLSGR